MADLIRDALVTTGGLRYVNQYAFVAKARRDRERAEREHASRAPEPEAPAAPPVPATPAADELPAWT